MSAQGLDRYDAMALTSDCLAAREVEALSAFESVTDQLRIREVRWYPVCKLEGQDCTDFFCHVGQLGARVTDFGLVPLSLSDYVSDPNNDPSVVPDNVPGMLRLGEPFTANNTDRPLIVVSFGLSRYEMVPPRLRDEAVFMGNAYFADPANPRFVGAWLVIRDGMSRTESRIVSEYRRPLVELAADRNGREQRHVLHSELFDGEPGDILDKTCTQEQYLQWLARLSDRPGRVIVPDTALF